MTQQTFLGAIAKAYSDNFDDLSEFCFVFPSRRCGTFFLKNLSECAERHVLLGPEVMAVGDFMQTVAGLDVAPRITQLMELYLAYRNMRNLNAELDSEEDLLDFDEFMPWGEVVLADFSEVDMYNVDAEKIFENVRDYRNIAADFLSDEQKEVIERYFGYRPDESEVRSFWIHFDRNNETSLKQKYLELWQRLPELYTALRERLEHPKKGLPMSMSGSGFRIAMEKVKEKGIDALPWKRIVVVGLDWLSTTEAELFSKLKRLGDANGETYIEFFWDATGPILGNKDNHAARAIQRNRSKKNFEEPAWAKEYLEQAHCQTLPELVEISVPSNAMQTKVAANKVQNLLKEGFSEDIKAAKIAVVLPDENLLLPLLHSLPYSSENKIKKEPGNEDKNEKIEKNGNDDKGNNEEKKSGLKSVNLTMGWNMKYTSTASFMYHLQRIHLRRRNIRNRVVYLTSDFQMLIAQPLVQVLVGMDTIQEINADITKFKRRVISAEEIAKYSETLGNMLQPISGDTKISESVAWLEQLLLSIDKALSESGNDIHLKTKVERMQLQVYLTALYRIEDSVRRAGINMRFNTLFHLLSRMTSGQKIQFKGEPLEGLQVMGLMETRALDFERVIILSMNDKVMPRHSRKRSFIPDALRRGYGMPLTVNDENRYAYWFYRLISRTNHSDMIYDSRVGEGMRSGGKSRFLMQLEKLYARDSIIHEICTFQLGTETGDISSVPKTESIMAKLDKFRSDDPLTMRKLSATALQTYLKCQVQFLYRFVLQYNDNDPNIGFIDAITQGNIFHDMMLNLYFSSSEQKKYLSPAKEFCREWFDTLLADETYLRQMMTRSVNKEYGKLPEEKLNEPLTASSQMVADRLLEQVKGVLRHDRELAPLHLIGGEVKDNVKWEVNPELTVNMTASFDRVELTPENRQRVVDFKTGTVHLEMTDGLNSVFAPDYKAGNVFQLLLYAHLMDEMGTRHGKARGPVEMMIFDTNGMQHGSGECRPLYKKPGSSNLDKIIDHSHPEVADFINRINEKIEEIFNPKIPFTPTEDKKQCEQCVMHTLCNR